MGTFNLSQQLFRSFPKYDTHIRALSYQSTGSLHPQPRPERVGVDGGGFRGPV